MVDIQPVLLGMPGLFAKLLHYFLVAKLATVSSPLNSPLPLWSCSVLCSGSFPGIPHPPTIQQLKVQDLAEQEASRILAQFWEFYSAFWLAY